MVIEYALLAAVDEDRRIQFLPRPSHFLLLASAPPSSLTALDELDSIPDLCLERILRFWYAGDGQSSVVRITDLVGDSG